MRYLQGHKGQRARDVSRRSSKTTGLTTFLISFLILVVCSATVPAGGVTLGWNASTSPTATGYKIYYGLTNGVFNASVNAGSNLTATVTGLTPGLTYYFAADSYNALGEEGSLSPAITDRLPILPFIIAQPLTQTAGAGASVTLTVTAGGDPALSYQWMKGLAPISGATNALLTWPQIMSSNAGNYSVVVSNPWGSVTSSVATLTVVVPPAITVQPKSQTVIASTAASLSSTVTGTAPLSFQWYFGMTAIAGATSGTLAWASVAPSNAGNYYFTVTNAGGAVTSAVATVTVVVPPAITVQPKSQTVIASTAASLSSTVTGTAPLSFQWYFGMTAIAEPPAAPWPGPVWRLPTRATITLR